MNRKMETLAVAGMGAAVLAHFLGVVFHRLQSGRWDKYAKAQMVMAGCCVAIVIRHALRLR